MKSPKIPSSSLSPAQRSVDENSLREGECLPGVDAQSVCAQEAFIARGLASRARARSDDVYFSLLEVFTKLQSRLAKAKNNSE
jgi:hypothetical protein